MRLFKRTSAQEDKLTSLDITDFSRRKKTDGIEQGVSLWRLNLLRNFGISPELEAIRRYWEPMKENAKRKNRIGLAVIESNELEILGYKFIVHQHNEAHVSLRCSSCDLQANNRYCLPSTNICGLCGKENGSEAIRQELSQKFIVPKQWIAKLYSQGSFALKLIQ